MLTELINRVKSFMLKHKFPIGTRLKDETNVSVYQKQRLEQDTRMLDRAAQMFENLGIDLQKRFGEYKAFGLEVPNRLVRAQLLVEETAEAIAALRDFDEIELADAMGDILYVVAGMALMYSIPLSGVITEICDSNDTKAPRDPNDTRLRSKGVDYRPPDIKKLFGDNDVPF